MINASRKPGTLTICTSCNDTGVIRVIGKTEEISIAWPICIFVNYNNDKKSLADALIVLSVGIATKGRFRRFPKSFFLRGRAINLFGKGRRKVLISKYSRPKGLI